MWMVVILELSHGKEIIPIILSFIHKEVKVLLQFLVDSFSLTIHLGVIGSRGCDANVKESVELMSEFVNKLHPPVQNNYLGDAMELPNMMEEQMCSPCSSDGGISWNEVSMF